MALADTSLTAPARDEKTDWWRGAVIYQIYPRSFQDSSGDGIGDLNGIVERLDYVASLGVDAIWISPFFKSPMKDFGYDVSDYLDVEPMFGALADVDRLVAKAHDLGLRVLVDLVLSHSSDQHPWFIESRARADNPKSDWYVWADPRDDGTPPNNWLSIFGGPAWQWSTERRQYYLHNFLAEQPDLNFHNPDVQDAVLEIARFWLERGVDGFRLDALNFFFHDAELRDNPALPPELRDSAVAPSTNPYSYQDHIFDRNREENLDFVQRFRALMDEFGAVTVGEIGDALNGLQLIGQYTAGEKRIHMCYAFDLLTSALPTARRIHDIIATVDDAVREGWVCWAFSNHDAVRHTSRWQLLPEAQRLMITLMMSLRGSATLYQGEELALPEADVAFEDLQDPYGIRFWPEFKGRDGCRTPMVWEAEAMHGGFSSASRTWLPISAAHMPLAVDRQEAEPGSMLHHYRKALAFRKKSDILQKGDLTDLAYDGDILHFVRTHGGQSLFCAFNISDTPSEIGAAQAFVDVIGEDLGGAGARDDKLGPWQAFFGFLPSEADENERGRNA